VRITNIMVRSHVIHYCFIVLHEMVAEEEDIFEQFKDAYSPLSQHHQDLAARWLDLGNNTLLYR